MGGADRENHYRDNDINKNDTPERCKTIRLGLSFCGRDAGWLPTDTVTDPDTDGGWRLNDRTYAVAIERHIVKCSRAKEYIKVALCQWAICDAREDTLAMDRKVKRFILDNPPDW